MFKPVHFVLTIAFLVSMVTHVAVNVGTAIDTTNVGSDPIAVALGLTARNNGPYVVVLDVLSISMFPLSYFTNLLK